MVIGKVVVYFAMSSLSRKRKCPEHNRLRGTWTPDRIFSARPIVQSEDRIVIQGKPDAFEDARRTQTLFGGDCQILEGSRQAANESG